MANRISNFLVKLKQENLDGFIISSCANISYLTEYTCRESYLLISKKANVYFTDSRYIEEAKNNLKGAAEIKKTNGSVFNIIARACLRLGLKRIGFEERHLAFAEYQKIKEGLKKKAELTPSHSLIEELRQIKEPEEISKIKEAVRITAEALKFIKKYVLPGKAELEIVAELERFIRYQGATNSAFEIIVASGQNSSFPHHIPTRRKVKDNELVLIDIGVNYLGYKCDLTRVFYSGKINSLEQKIYGIVLEAQDRAIRKIRPGVSIKEVDAASRQYISQRGFGRFFGHNLGHGIGLEVHEEPNISGENGNAVKTGMVFTVEPAIYLPGKFGVRIEDMILVTKKGAEVLSGAVLK